MMYDRVKILYGKERKLKLFLILFLMFFVSLNLISAKIFEENGYFYVEQELEKQWNLIAGISFSEKLHKDSNLGLDSIFKSRYYDAENKKDVEIRPSYKAGDIDPLILYSNAFWVFSIKPGKIVYKVSPSFIDKSYLNGYYQLYEGKNLVAINEEMYGKKINEIKSSCEIDNAYIWDAELQDWIQIDLNQELNFESRDSLTGKGINIIVKEDCKFMKINVGVVDDTIEENEYEFGGRRNSISPDNDEGVGYIGDPEPTSNIIKKLPKIVSTKEGVLGTIIYYSLLGVIIVLILGTVWLIFRFMKRSKSQKTKLGLRKSL